MRWPALIFVAAVSLVFFIAAATVPSDDQALALVVIGAIVPSIAFGIEALIRMQRWRKMGREMGLIEIPGGGYPDLKGRFKGRRLHVSRRVNPHGRPRLMTRVSLEGAGDILAPGVLLSSLALRTMLEPLLPEHQASRGGVNADQEADDGAAIE